jgi:hypothetical protein
MEPAAPRRGDFNSEFQAARMQAHLVAHANRRGRPASRSELHGRNVSYKMAKV